MGDIHCNICGEWHANVTACPNQVRRSLAQSLVRDEVVVLRERIAALEADRDKWHGTAKQQVATLVEAGKIQGELREKVESLEAALAGAVPREVAERACDLMGGMFHKMSRHPEQFGEWHVVGDPEKSVPPFAEQNPEIDPTIRKWSGPAIARALREHAANAARAKGEGT